MFGFFKRLFGRRPRRTEELLDEILETLKDVRDTVTGADPATRRLREGAVSEREIELQERMLDIKGFREVGQPRPKTTVAETDELKARLKDLEELSG